MCKTKNLNISIKKPDGGLAVNESAKTEIFKQHLSDIFFTYSDIYSPHNINSVEEFLNAPLPVCLPVKHFTPNEVKYIIDKYPLINLLGLTLLQPKLPDACPKKQLFTTHIFSTLFLDFPTFQYYSGNTQLLFLSPIPINLLTPSHFFDL